MKLTCLLIICGMFQGIAASMGQSINIKKNKITYGQLFREIQQQTGYDVLLNTSNFNLEKSMVVAFENVSLKDVLRWIKSSENIDYTFDGKSIVLHPVLPARAAVLALQSVRGKVIDSSGKGILGVNITVKDKHIRLSTDSQGEFILNGIQANDVLVVSMLGYKKQVISIEGRKNITIVLEESYTQINEVQVVNTGFQTITKERATGSFGTVSKEQLEKPSTSIAQRLIGTIAGMQARSMDENGNPVFEIRGQTSLLANAAPLVVVDGFPIQGDFSTINPNDVESVTVLKDAAAASIWGARAANGVVVIVTKNAGASTPLKVDFSAFTRIGAKLDLDYVRPLASSSETVEYEKLAFKNWRPFPGPSGSPLDVEYFAFSSAATALQEAENGFITAEELASRLEALKKLNNKKQISDHLLSNPITTQFNVSLSGGSVKTRNFFSALYEDNQSNFKGTDGKRYMLNFRNSSELAKWLTIDVGAMFQQNKNHNNGAVIQNSDPYIPNRVVIGNWSPYDMLLNPDGSYTNIQQYYMPIVEREVPVNSFPYADWTFNPLQEIANRDYRVEQSQIRLQAALNFKIIQGLTAELRGQYELGNSYTRNFDNENTFHVRNAVNFATYWNRNATPNTFTANLPKGGILDQRRGKAESYNIRGQLNFNRTFSEDHEINFLSGIEFRNMVSESFVNPTAYGFNEETLAVGTFPNGPGGLNAAIYDYYGYPQTFAYVNSFSDMTQRLFSAFGNASYTYKGRYTASGSYRFDASNLITDDPEYRYAPFYSAGLSWKLKQEGFLKTVAWVDRLTARLTYGHLGNYDPSTSFSPLITPSSSQDIYINAYTAGFSSFGNPTLRWERTKSWNVGVDFNLFNNKLNGKIDLYHKKGSDLLAVLSIPSIHGTSSQRLNNAAMNNKGIELELGTTQDIVENLVWSGNVNLSYNKNKITDLFVLNYNSYQMFFGRSAAYVVGEDANSLWRREYAGIESNQPTYYGPDLGKYSFDSWIQGDARRYMRNMGTAVAPLTLGFMNSFRYKNLGFSFVLTGKFGHKFQRLGFNYPSLVGSRVLPNQKLSEVMDADPSKIVPLPLDPNQANYHTWYLLTNAMSYLIQNASHVRMQEINVNYAMPANIINKIGLGHLQVYIQGNDLFTIYANEAKEDPEFPLGTLKPMPKFTIGFRCNF